MSEPVPAYATPARTVAQKLSSHRTQKFFYELLDRTGAVLGPLTGARDGGSLTWTANQAIKGRGHLPYLNDGQAVNWLSSRIRVSVQVSDSVHGGEPVTIPLGVWVPSAPRWRRTKARPASMANISLLSRERVLARIKLPNGYALPAGTVITTAIRSLIEAAGESAGAITASSKTLAELRTWPIGTTALQVINDLANAGGYLSLWSDGIGQFRLSPRLRPSERRRVWDFTGSTAAYVPDLEWEEDLDAVPNCFLAVQKASGEAEPLVAEAKNLDPNSPLSVPARGEVWAEEEEFDAADTGVLQAHANRRLAELTNATAQAFVDHLILPIGVNDVVWFPAVRGDANGLHVVTQTSVTMRSTGRAASTFTGVLIDA